MANSQHQEPLYLNINLTGKTAEAFRKACDDLELAPSQAAVIALKLGLHEFHTFAESVRRGGDYIPF